MTKKASIDDHLKFNEYEVAVWEGTGLEKDENIDYDSKRVNEHLSNCSQCYGLIERTRERHPIYQAFLKRVPDEITSDEFWKEYRQKLSQYLDKEF